MFTASRFKSKVDGLDREQLVTLRRLVAEVLSPEEIKVLDEEIRIRRFGLVPNEVETDGDDK